LLFEWQRGRFEDVGKGLMGVRRKWVGSGGEVKRCPRGEPVNGRG